MPGNDERNIKKAVEKAANFDRLETESADQEKRADYRTKAKFQRSIAEELKIRLKLDEESSHAETSGTDTPQHRPGGDPPPV